MDKAPSGNEKQRRRGILMPAIAAGVLLVGGLIWTADMVRQVPRPPDGQFAHQGITTTVFWVGEAADASNANIPNSSSTWTEDWLGAYGGVDDPNNRCGLLPCAFTPKENPFYFALPYNDLDTACNTKSSQQQIPWVQMPTTNGNSAVKNQWIQIRHGEKVAYAQWEDAGPLGEDDTAYVFGDAQPHYWSGLDLSPATAKYLELDGKGATDWQFVPESEVPDGPWRNVITTSPPDCAK